MGELTLLSDYCLDTTVLSNIYIDEYMASNNEAQVKIYLYLLRKLSSGASVSVISIADFFNYTVMDVERALFFMEKQGLMKLEVSDNRILGIRILPLVKKESFKRDESKEVKKIIETNNEEAMDSSREVIVFDKKPQYSKEEIIEFASLPEITDLIFAAEQYLGKMITQDDIQNLYYMNRTLGLNEDVIDYLIGYCISLKKKSFGYMSKVAKDWAESGVKTVKDAKKLIDNCPKEVYDIFNAFGIKSGSRKPSASEIKYTRLWIEDYGFSMDVIELACVLTVEKTHSISFEYADAILRDWSSKGVKHPSDVDKINQEYAEKRKQNESSVKSSGKAKQAGNKFSGYSQRDYDFDELEKRLLSN